MLAKPNLEPKMLITVYTFKCRSLKLKYPSKQNFMNIFPLLTSSYLPNPSARAGYDTRSIFKRSLTGFNSEFSFS